MVRGSIYDNMKLSRRIFFSHEPLWKKAEAVESFMFLQNQRVDKRLLKVNIFVAFCKFFLGSLTVVHSGGQLKISGIQLKSSPCLTFWFKLLPKTEIGLKHLSIFSWKNQRFSIGYPKMSSTDFIFRQQENLVVHQKCLPMKLCCRIYVKTM